MPNRLVLSFHAYSLSMCKSKAVDFTRCDLMKFTYIRLYVLQSMWIVLRELFSYWKQQSLETLSQTSWKWFPDLPTDGEPQFPHCQNENSACPKTQQIGIHNTVQCLPLDKPGLITKSGGSSESCTEWQNLPFGSCYCGDSIGKVTAN